MAIQITYNAGVYEVNGLLNSQNSISLENHINGIMNTCRGVVLSLEEAIQIEAVAITSIIALGNKALANDKLFYIIGGKDELINEQF